MLMLIMSGTANEEGLFQNKIMPYFFQCNAFARVYLSVLGLSSMLHRDAKHAVLTLVKIKHRAP